MTDEVADPELARYLEQAPAFAHLDVAELRAGSEERVAARPPGPAMAEVADLSTGGLDVRLYRPGGVDGRGLVVFLHGGGWTIGSIATHDATCRRLAAGSGARVLSVGYRLAPEHPWPASVNDTVAVLRWVTAAPPEIGALGAVAVAGDSAGGTLAALACLRLRDEAPDALPDLQVLVYANTDLTGELPSMREKGTGWGLEATAVRFFNAQWVPDRQRWGDPGVSPLHAPDVSGLPPALVVSAEHDPLRDETEAYAARLADAGVDVELRREAGIIHGFLQMYDTSPACAAAADRLAADLRARLA